MLVEELMTTEVVTVNREATLDEAVAQLLTHGVGSVIVVQDGNLGGIVIESDDLATRVVLTWHVALSSAGNLVRASR